MSKQFTASNGLGVQRDFDGLIGVTDGFNSFNLGHAHSLAVKEFLEHERDVEFGRWRDPVNPDIVVKSTGKAPNRTLHLFNERTHEATYEYESTRRERPTCDSPSHRYLEAHPSLKMAWDDAKPGEVWLVVFDNCEFAAVVDGERYFRFYDDGYDRFSSVRGKSITAGRRIYPEADDE